MNNIKLLNTYYKNYTDYIISNKLDRNLYYIESNNNFFVNINKDGTSFIKINNSNIFFEYYKLISGHTYRFLNDELKIKANYYLDLSVKLGNKEAKYIKNENNIIDFNIDLFNLGNKLKNKEITLFN